MFTLEKTFTFEAAHRLPDHDGHCANLHGHSFRCTLIVEGDRLQESGAKRGMLVDYGDLSKAVEGIHKQYLDHQFLNESLQLRSPTSELIARRIYELLKSRVPLLVAVTIEETGTARCTYRP